MSFIKESEHLTKRFRDIEVATKNFNTPIGKGGYGQVYKGELSIFGKLTTVAVKRLDGNISGQGFKEFLTEIQLLSRYKHPNLISLLGFCQEGNEKILIYEYAEHGSLDKYLNTSKTTSPLTWKQRIKICIDAANGLNYLHNHVAKNQRVIHRDIKSANILIDKTWKAMIADLGLSKIGRANENDTYLITNASGTHGYCDPAYIYTGILTKESDVYSFGVVLFEVLCGRLCFVNVNNSHRFLPQLAKRYYVEEKLNQIIDPDLKNYIDSDSMNAFSEIAYQCLDDNRSKRPSMRLVLQKLQEALELLEYEEAKDKMKEIEENAAESDDDLGFWFFDDARSTKAPTIPMKKEVIEESGDDMGLGLLDDTKTAKAPTIQKKKELPEESDDDLGLWIFDDTKSSKTPTVRQNKEETDESDDDLGFSLFDEAIAVPVKREEIVESDHDYHLSLFEFSDWTI